MGAVRSESPKLAVADLFSGAGGLSAGFSAAGFELAFALDKDEDSCVTYERNFRFAPEHASITDFEPSDLAGKLTDVDVILGGPSCQTFSTQGRRFKWADPDDERTKLWTHMLALVDEVRPRAFLLENVPGLSHKGLAYEKDGRAQGEIVTHFEKLGYTLRAAILLAADYGVPQLRRRLFVVGVEEGVEFEFPEPTHLGAWRRDGREKWEEERIRRGLLRHLTLRDALGDLPPLLSGALPADEYLREAESGYEKVMRVGWKGALRDHEVRPLGEKHMALVRHVPPGGTWRDIPPHLLPERFQGGCGGPTVRTCSVASISICRRTRSRHSSTTSPGVLHASFREPGAVGPGGGSSTELPRPFRVHRYGLVALPTDRQRGAPAARAALGVRAWKGAGPGGEAEEATEGDVRARRAGACSGRVESGADEAPTP